MVLEKTLESPLDCKEIQPVLSKDQSWVFIGKTDAKAETPVSTGFSRQEYWSGLPCPPPGDLSDPGIEPVSLISCALQAGSLPLAPPGKLTFTGPHIFFALHT